MQPAGRITLDHSHSRLCSAGSGCSSESVRRRCAPSAATADAAGVNTRRRGRGPARAAPAWRGRRAPAGSAAAAPRAGHQVSDAHTPCHGNQGLTCIDSAVRATRRATTRRTSSTGRGPAGMSRLGESNPRPTHYEKSAHRLRGAHRVHPSTSPESPRTPGPSVGLHFVPRTVPGRRSGTVGEDADRLDGPPGGCATDELERALGRVPGPGMPVLCTTVTGQWRSQITDAAFSRHPAAWRRPW
jgi:hypothetical protein